MKGEIQRAFSDLRSALKDDHQTMLTELKKTRDEIGRNAQRNRTAQ
jgi:hypothetical protein